jgi:hypothetical protein
VDIDKNNEDTPAIIRLATSVFCTPNLPPRYSKKYRTRIVRRAVMEYTNPIVSTERKSLRYEALRYAASAMQKEKKNPIVKSRLS